MLSNQRNVLELEFASTASGVGLGSVIEFDPHCPASAPMGLIEAFA